MADTRETRHRREAQRQAAGMCKRCGKNKTGGPKHCKICLSGANARTKAMWQRRKDAGICWNCGVRPAAKKRTWCAACRSTKMWEKRRKIRTGVCNACLAQPPAKGYKACERCRGAQVRHRERLRDDVFTAYGGYQCACCGETEKRFLTIDHIEQKARGAPKRLATGGALLLSRLRRDGYPSGFQVLCRNCNWGKFANGGVCPHRVAA